MKLTQSVLCYGLVTLAMATISCKKEKKEEVKPAPTVKIDSLPGSARGQAFFGVGDAISLKYSVNSGDNLSNVSYSESATPSSIQGKTTAPRTTGFDSPTTYSSTYNTTFPQDANTLTVNITANDSKAKTATASFTGRAIILNRLIGGSSYDNGKSFYSTGNNTIYNSNDFGANKDKIDITFGHFAADGAVAAPMLISSDERTNLNITLGGGGQKVYFKESTLNFTSASAADVYKLTPSNSQRVRVASGKVYEFVSPATNAKGLINVTAVTVPSDATQATLRFDLKSIVYK